MNDKAPKPYAQIAYEAMLDNMPCEHHWPKWGDLADQLKEMWFLVAFGVISEFQKDLDKCQEPETKIEKQ